jgi:hypothetical protein
LLAFNTTARHEDAPSQLDITAGNPAIALTVH